MVQEQATTQPAQPDLARPESAVQEPPQEQTPAPATPTQEPASKPKPVNVAALQAGFTQNGQRNADIKRALGLPATTSHEEVLSFIGEQKAPAPNADLAELDPQLAEGYAALNERSWSIARRTYGDEFADQVLAIRELVLGTTDPFDLSAAVYEMAGKLAQAQAGTQQQPPPANGAEAPAPEQQAAQPPQQQDGQSLVSPGQDPGWRVEMDEADKVGSGDMEGFFSKVFGR